MPIFVTATESFVFIFTDLICKWAELKISENKLWIRKEMKLVRVTRVPCAKCIKRRIIIPNSVWIQLFYPKLNWIKCEICWDISTFCSVNFSILRKGKVFPQPLFKFSNICILWCKWTEEKWLQSRLNRNFLEREQKN